MKIKRLIFIIMIFVLVCCAQNKNNQSDKFKKFPRPQIKFDPETYICYQSTEALQIDGKLDEKNWKNAEWSNYFRDIEGDLKPKPTYKTRMKMLWDDEYLYFGAYLEEPHVWAKLQQRDTVVFYDNDFEIFIDPDGDTHEYYEFEMNALNTVWDLLLTKPYRDGGNAINKWDIHGLKSAVFVDGTINDPSDIDKGWSIEVAIPWDVLKECANRPTPPNNKDQWRLGFSRVEWKTEIKNNNYAKSVDPLTGKHYHENNWIWSPQGLIAMHYPELWGIVQFSTKNAGSKKVKFIQKDDYKIKCLLYTVYYAEKEFMENYGKYTDKIEELIIQENIDQIKDNIIINITDTFFSIEYSVSKGEKYFVHSNGKSGKINK